MVRLIARDYCVSSQICNRMFVHGNQCNLFLDANTSIHGAYLDTMCLIIEIQWVYVRERTLILQTARDRPLLPSRIREHAMYIQQATRYSISLCNLPLLVVPYLRCHGVNKIQNTKEYMVQLGRVMQFYQAILVGYLKRPQSQQMMFVGSPRDPQTSLVIVREGQLHTDCMAHTSLLHG